MTDHESKKLTDWKKEPKLQDLKLMLTDAATEHQSQVSKIRDWESALTTTGRYAPKKVAGRSRIQPKLVRKQAEWRYSALTEPFLSSDQMFTVSPVTFEDVDAAKQNELLINWQFRTKINTISFIDNLVRATVDEGTSIVRIGWEQESIEVTEPVPEWTYYPVDEESEEGEMYLQHIDEAIQLKEANPRGYSEQIPEELKAAIDYIEQAGIPVRAELTGYVPVKVQKIIKNQPTVQVCDPESVILDPTCRGDISKAMFVIFDLDVSQHELLNSNADYKNLDKIRWESDKSPGEIGINETTNFTFKDKMKNKQKMYEYWGYHDINDDGHVVPIVASWIGDTLIRLEESPFPDKKLPVVVIPYLPVKRSIYGETDAELLKENQMVQGALMRGLIDIMGRSANGQTGFARGLLDSHNKRKYEAGQDYDFNVNTSHPNGGIYQHTFPAIPDSALTLMSVMSSEGDSLTGVKSFSGGISGESYGKVATGIRGALDSAAKREMAILRRIANGLKEIAGKIMAMNAEFLSEDEVVRVTNTQFITINKDDLQGNFDLQVDISTAEVDEQKAQDLSFMLQTLGPSIDQSITFMIMSEIAKLKRMPDLANQLLSIDTSPTENDLLLQELEMQKVQLEVAKLESEAAWNQARAAKEQASAAFIALNTQDVATGVSHARDIERMIAQSESNQSLAVTKAILAAKKQGEAEPDIEAAIGFNELTKQMSSQSVSAMAQLRASILPQNDLEQSADPEGEELQGDPNMLPPEEQV